MLLSVFSLLNDLGGKMKRTKRREFVMNEKEARELTEKAKMACMTESHLIRLLIAGYHPPVAPGDEFYRDLNKVIEVADKLQLTSEFMNSPEIVDILRSASMDLKELTLEIRKRYLRGEREKIQWR